MRTGAGVRSDLDSSFSDLDSSLAAAVSACAIVGCSTGGERSCCNDSGPCDTSGPACRGGEKGLAGVAAADAVDDLAGLLSDWVLTFLI
jgi:hypothetical protein